MKFRFEWLKVIISAAAVVVILLIDTSVVCVDEMVFNQKNISPKKIA